MCNMSYGAVLICLIFLDPIGSLVSILLIVRFKECKSARVQECKSVRLDVLERLCKSVGLWFSSDL